MRNILVIGATGQIGSELTMKLRKIYGNRHVVCGYIPSAKPKLLARKLRTLRLPQSLESRAAIT